MNIKDPSQLSIELIDEQTTFRVVDLCRSCSVQADLIESLVEHGILEPKGTQIDQWCFPSNSLRRTRITVNLQRDLGVNLAGAALALELLEHIDDLNAKLRTRKHAVIHRE
jgi:chaperone modulatory protein CbpM